MTFVLILYEYIVGSAFSPTTHTLSCQRLFVQIHTSGVLYTISNSITRRMGSMLRYRRWSSLYVKYKIKTIFDRKETFMFHLIKQLRLLRTPQNQNQTLQLFANEQLHSADFLPIYNIVIT